MAFCCFLGYNADVQSRVGACQGCGNRRMPIQGVVIHSLIRESRSWNYRNLSSSNKSQARVSA